MTSRLLNERYECGNSLEHEKIVVVDHKFFVTKQGVMTEWKRLRSKDWNVSSCE